MDEYLDNAINILHAGDGGRCEEAPDPDLTPSQWKMLYTLFFTCIAVYAATFVFTFHNVYYYLIVD